jgi:hypothetical protein
LPIPDRTGKEETADDGDGDEKRRTKILVDACL